jgi:hypothetical protein
LEKMAALSSGERREFGPAERWAEEAKWKTRTLRDLR